MWCKNQFKLHVGLCAFASISELAIRANSNNISNDNNKNNNSINHSNNSSSSRSNNNTNNNNSSRSNTINNIGRSSTVTARKRCRRRCECRKYRKIRCKRYAGLRSFMSMSAP